MKKIISLFLALVLVAAAFSGCSKSEKQNEPETENTVKITVDTHYSDFDESAVSAYEKLCNAVINGEEEVKFNTSLVDDVNQLYYTGFPLYALVDSLEFSSDNTGYIIKYKNSKEEHIALVKEFNDKILSIMDSCEYGKVSTNTYIFNVYTYITQNFTADSTVLTAYDALLQNKGYSSAINSLFEYLVLQGGGKASHAMGNVGASIVSLVQFNGTWYYFDPYNEIVENQGKALKYFAMSDSSMKTTYSYTDGEAVGETGDGSFNELRQSQSFTVDGSKVSVTCQDSTTFDFQLN